MTFISAICHTVWLFTQSYYCFSM